MSNNIASPRQHGKKDIAEKLYHALGFSESSIIQDIDKCKKDEIRVNNDLMWFSSCDTRREWKKQHIKNVEKDLRKTVNHELGMTSNRKFDELTSRREFYVYWTQHGNRKRVEEAICYHIIRDVDDEIETCTVPTAATEDWRDYFSWTPALTKGYKQQQLKVVSNQLEKSWTIRRGQLHQKLDLLKKDIKRMERELETISSLRKKAYKCAYKHGDKQNEEKSSYTEYNSLMTYVKELARRGDTDELIKVCRTQLL